MKTVTERRPNGEKSKVRTLLRKSGHDLAVFERIDVVKFLTLRDQFCKFVSNLFNSSHHLFPVFPRPQYDDHNVLILCAKSVMGVCEVADNLVQVKTARWIGTRIRAGKQTDVEARLVRAIDDRRFPKEAVENLAAVTAPAGISLHRKTLFTKLLLTRTVTEWSRNSDKAGPNAGVGEPMRGTLPVKMGTKPTVFQKVGRLKLGACFYQLRNFIGSTLSQLKNPSSVSAWPHDSLRDVLVVRPKFIADIEEGADTSTGTKVGASVQSDVKSLPVRTVDNRDLLGDPKEGLSAVSALPGVSLQRSTPVAGAISAKTVSERGWGSEESKVKTSCRKSWREMAGVEGISSHQLVTFLDQVRKLVGRVFNLTKYAFRIFRGVSYDDGNRVVLGPELIMRIRKIANCLFAVVAEARTWSREQRHMKGSSVTIYDGSLSNTSKRLPTMRTSKIGVSQVGTPFAEMRPATTVSERGPGAREIESQNTTLQRRARTRRLSRYKQAQGNGLPGATRQFRQLQFRLGEAALPDREWRAARKR